MSFRILADLQASINSTIINLMRANVKRFDDLKLFSDTHLLIDFVCLKVGSLYAAHLPTFMLDKEQQAVVHSLQSFDCNAVRWLEAVCT
jgi:hypothetical protein